MYLIVCQLDYQFTKSKQNCSTESRNQNNLELRILIKTTCGSDVLSLLFETLSIFFEVGVKSQTIKHFKFRMQVFIFGVAVMCNINNYIGQT